jgi:putative hemolysin
MLRRLSRLFSPSAIVDSTPVRSKCVAEKVQATAVRKGPAMGTGYASNPRTKNLAELNTSLSASLPNTEAKFCASSGGRVALSGSERKGLPMAQ